MVFNLLFAETAKSSRHQVLFYCYYYLILFRVFHTNVSHRRLGDSKSHQNSRTLLRILADLTNAVLWMISTGPIISQSSSPCTNSLVTLPNEPITIGIAVIFIFQFFISILLCSAGTAKSTIQQVKQQSCPY